MKVRLRTQVRIPGTNIYIPKDEIMVVDEIMGNYYICEYLVEKENAIYYPVIFIANCEVVEK